MRMGGGRPRLAGPSIDQQHDIDRTKHGSLREFPLAPFVLIERRALGAARTETGGFDVRRWLPCL